MKRSAKLQLTQPLRKPQRLIVPKTTKIAGYTIKIALGHCHELGAEGMYRDRKIVLDPRNDVETQEGAYVHELIECINELHDLSLPHDKIQTLGLSLHQALTSGNGDVE